MRGDGILSGDPISGKGTTARVLIQFESAQMPILILLLILIVLIAQIGFWDTFAAVLGGIAMLILFALLLIAAVILTVFLTYRRLVG